MKTTGFNGIIQIDQIVNITHENNLKSQVKVSITRFVLIKIYIYGINNYPDWHRSTGIFMIISRNIISSK